MDGSVDSGIDIDGRDLEIPIGMNQWGSSPGRFIWMYNMVAPRPPSRLPTLVISSNYLLPQSSKNTQKTGSASVIMGYIFNMWDLVGSCHLSLQLSQEVPFPPWQRQDALNLPEICLLKWALWALEGRFTLSQSWQAASPLPGGLEEESRPPGWGLKLLSTWLLSTSSNYLVISNRNGLWVF